MKQQNARGRSAKGFSLSEVLFALILLGFVGMIVAGGISAALRVHRNVTDRANAELLLTTSLTKIRGELDMVRQVVVSDSEHSQGDLWAYRDSQTSGFKTLLRRKPASDKDGYDGIYLRKYLGWTDQDSQWTADVIDPTKAATTPVSDTLLTDAAAAKTLMVTYDTLTCTVTNNIPTFTVTNIRVIKNGNSIISMESYTFTGFNEVEVLQ